MSCLGVVLNKKFWMSRFWSRRLGSRLRRSRAHSWSIEINTLSVHCALLCVFIWLHVYVACISVRVVYVA